MVTFLGVLQGIFVALRLLGKITWSWAWVLSPIWISAVLFIMEIIIDNLSWRILMKSVK